MMATIEPKPIYSLFLILRSLNMGAPDRESSTNLHCSILPCRQQNGGISWPMSAASGQDFALECAQEAKKPPEGGLYRLEARRPGLDGLLLLAAFFARDGGDAHAQGVQLDEAASVGLVVGAAVFVEGGDVHAEQRIGFR